MKVKLLKHKKSLIVSIWVIAIGIILWVSGAIVGDLGIIYHPPELFTSGWYEYTLAFYVGVGMQWAGVIALILGFFGIITTVIMEYWDRERKQPQPST